MPTPLELANEIRGIIAEACNCKTQWIPAEVDAHEYAVIHEKVNTLLADLREKAITEDLKPTNEELEEFWN